MHHRLVVTTWWPAFQVPGRGVGVFRKGHRAPCPLFQVQVTSFCLPQASSTQVLGDTEPGVLDPRGQEGLQSRFGVPGKASWGQGLPGPVQAGQMC